MESTGFLHKWRDKDWVHLVSVLADVTYLLKGLQKSLQKESCVFSDLPKLKDKIVKELETLKGTSLIGGWEEAFVANLDEENKFFGIELKQFSQRTSSHHLFVSNRRDFATVRLEVILSLQNFLSDRLAIDDDELAEAVDALRPEKFSALASDKIHLIHKKLLPDMELREVNQSLEIAVDALLTNSTLTHFQLMKVLLQKNDDDYKPTLARTAATMPHSMDVERLVSSYNLIKSTDRSSLSSDTLHDYLTVRHNIPCVSQFDVRPAVEKWNTRVQRRP